MKSEYLSRDKILEMLKQGCSLLYFYMDGGVSIHDASNTPKRDCVCPVDIFLSLREEGVIEHTGSNNTGYPHYANNAKSDIYKLKVEKKQVLKTLTLDQFRLTGGSGKVNWITGQALIGMLQFDPSKCLIQVNEEGYLFVKQEGLNVEFISLPGFWEEIK